MTPQHLSMGLLLLLPPLLALAFWLGLRRARATMQLEQQALDAARSSALVALQENHLLHARQHALMDSIDDLAWLKDDQSRFVLVNRKFGEVFQRSPASIVGLNDHDLSPPDLAAHYQAHDQLVMAQRSVERLEEQILRPDGALGWAETIKVPVLGPDGTVVGTAGIARDISAQKAYQRQIEFLAAHDPLTGLFNRRHLEVQFQPFADTHGRFAALFLDLDNFKLINDTDGHSIGDELLRQLATRLSAAMPAHALLTRLGGDEFMVLLPLQSDQPGVLDGQAAALADTVGAPYDIDGARYVVSCSIGIAVYPEHGADRLTLIKHADIAMYEAKEKGRNRVCWFVPGMAVDTLTRRDLEQLLRDALQHGLFELHYQPLVETRSQRIVGAEALLRLRDRNGVWISPANFIPIAEQTGLIEQLGDWVLDAGLAQLAQWRAVGHHDLLLAINISGSQLDQPGFVEHLAQRLHDTQVPGSALELELTEGVLMSNVAASILTLSRLADLGISLAIDDFGTGYSSLAYLKQLPIHRLKIDKSFIDGLPEDSGDVVITRAILHLASTFGFAVTAEGVETAAQLAFLSEAQCNNVQGYHFSPAVPAAQFASLLAASQAKAGTA